MTFFTIILRFLVKNSRPIITILAVLIAGGSLLFTFWKLRKNKQYDDQATSLLKKIEYVEELKLTTYYYEEVVTIGTRARVSKVVDRTRAKLKKLEEVLFSIEYDFATAEAKRDSAFEAYYAVDTALVGLRDKLRLTRTYYKEINKTFFADVKKRLASDSTAFGTRMQSAYGKFIKTSEILKNTRGRKREARRNLKIAEDNLKSAWQYEKEKRRNTRDKYLEKYELMRAQQQKEEKRLRKQKDAAVEVYEKVLKKFEKAQQKVDEQSSKLAKAEDELKKAIETGEDTEPKLLIVVPAEVSGFIDMRKLKYKEIGIGDGRSGDTLLVILPPPELDSVNANLDSTANFRLDKMINVSLSTSDDGFYYDIFQQLRDAVKETEDLVREKAISSGIKAETQKMGEEYVREFAGSMGFVVEFVDRFPVPQDAYSLDSTVVDTTQRIFDTTGNVISQEELMKSLGDSLD